MSEAVEKALNEIRRVEGAITAALSEQEKKSGDSSQKLGDEIKSLNQEWEAKAKDLRELYEKSVSETNTVNVELKRRVEDLEKRLGHPGAISGQAKSTDEREAKSIGQRFIEFLQDPALAPVIGDAEHGFKSLRSSGRSPAMTVGAEFGKAIREQKSTILSSDATRMVVPFRDVDMAFPQRALSLRQFMRVVPVNSNAFEYLQHKGTGPDTALSVVSVVAGDGSTATEIATLSAAAAHGLKVGDWIQVNDSTDTDYNGLFRVDSVPSSTTLTYTMLAVPGDATADGTITYRPLSFGGAPAERAEGGTKAQAEFLWELVTGNIRSIAHYIPASKEVLDDLPRLRAMIDSTMIYGVQLKEERQAFYGSGSSNQVQGLSSLPGIINLSQGSLTAVDVIRRARTLVHLSDLQANLCVMNPLDWESVERKKGSDDHYVLAAGAAGSDPNVWRLPVLETGSVLPGDVFVGAFGMGGTLYDRQNATIDFTDSHGENFISNILVIRAESRIGYGWEYPQAFCKIAFTG